MTYIACESQFPEMFEAVLMVESQPALQVCTHCEFQLGCLKQVDPATSGFDGVSGGYVWANGRVKTWSVKDDGPLNEYRRWLTTRKVTA